MNKQTEALKLALEALEPFITPNWAGCGVDKANAAYAALCEAQASGASEESSGTEQPAPMQHGILARKWILHGGFADVASFDADGVPSFYWKESVAKFKAGELSTPCKGKNCGSLNGWLHSAECRAEHEAQYTVPQTAQQGCMRCNTPKKCALYGCSPLTWPAKQPAQQDPVNLADIIEGMSVSVDVSTGETDAEHRYFGTVTEVMEDPHDKHGLTLLVQDAKPNFDPAAQQEPVAVAWMWVVDGKPHNVTFGGANSNTPKDWTVLPLYTSPPAQRKPKTEEFIKHAWANSAPNIGFGDFLVLFRAIEAAHGITENTK